MIHIDARSAMKAIREAVDEKGESYVYTYKGEIAPHCQCEYVELVANPDDGDEELIPSCIVGHVLHRLGVDLDALNAIGGGVLGLFMELEQRSLVTYDRDAMTLLSIAQSAQDAGAPWGAAMRAANAYYAHSL